jgi:hypothetical protein
VAEHRHKRDTDARRLLSAFSATRNGSAHSSARGWSAKKVSAGLAVMATTSIVAVGVLGATPGTGDLLAADGPGPVAASLSASADADSLISDRFTVSRSSSRTATREDKQKLVKAARADGALAATAKAVRKAHTKLWTTAPLNLWTTSADDAVQVGEVAASRQVLVTGRQAGERVEIVVAGKSRWVTDGYLSQDKPLGVGAGLSMAPCPDPGVESGLTSAAVYVYRSVCHAFPQITTYGGWDNHGEHSSGRALDIMTSDVTLGTAIAEFLRAHSSELHLYDILWRQRIWTPVRAAEGWRTFPSRGSATANHYDHVHVSVY